MSIESAYNTDNPNETAEHHASVAIDVEAVDLPATQVDVRHDEAPALTEEEIEAAAKYVDAHDIHKARAIRIMQYARGGVVRLQHHEAEDLQDMATRDAAVDRAIERRKFN